jgi:hypothetical protein
LLSGSSDRVLVAFNNSARVVVTDETGPWGTVDLGRYFQGTKGAVNTGLVEGDVLLIGTSLGLSWVDMRDGTYGFFSGIPFGSVVSLIDNGKGGVLAGISGLYSIPGPPAVYSCALDSRSCTLSNTGMNGANEYSSAVADFAAIPGASGAPTMIFAGTQAGGIYRTTDGGSTWTPSGSGFPPFDAIYRVFTTGGNLFVGAGDGLYVSFNTGGSWTKAAGLPSGYVTGIDGTGSTVFAGVNSSSGTAVYKSTNAGSSWQQTGPGITAIRINSIAVGKMGVYAATNGGTFRSTDGGVTWAGFNAGDNSASILQILPVGSTIYVGTFGNLSGVCSVPMTGGPATCGDATIANKIIRGIGSVGGILVAAGETGAFRSTDAGATWVPTMSGLNPYSLLATGTTFYCGLRTGGVYKSSDGASWAASGTGLPQSIGVVALAAAGGTLYAGAGPKVYRSTDGGGSWTAGGSVYAADPAYSIWTLSVIGNVLYAGLYGYGTPETHGVYKSLDGGTTWARASSGFPVNSPAYAITSIGNTLFAALQGGLFQSTDAGASWAAFNKKLDGIPIWSLAASGSTLYVGPAGRSLLSYQIPVQTTRLVPIVLDVDTGSAHYTTELALTNRGTSDASVTLTYTASLGSGSGTASESPAAGRQLVTSESLPAGKQMVIPDAIAYLRGRGLPIPTSGSQAGTLLFTFDGVSAPEAVAVTARTATATAVPQPVGRAGLAYSALDPATDSIGGSLTVYGLRSNPTDRSNLAIFNTFAEPVTLKVTAYSGDGDGKTVVVDSGHVLPGYGWYQYSGILANAGIANGYVTVERVSASGAFSAYGVVNDNGTNDGSYILPTTRNTGLDYLNVPVLVETSSFLSELVLANSGPTAATFTLAYSESLNPSAGAGGSFNVPPLAPGTQRIIPSALAFLRQNGVAIGPPGASYAGSLHVTVSGAFVYDTFAGARTASPSPAGGQFGLFTPAFYPGSEALDQAYLYGLRADSANRSNVAVINTAASAAGGSITLQLQAYDGDAGGVPRGAPLNVTLSPGQWAQPAGFFASQGVANGWVKVTRVAGSAPWLAYGVVNDGGNPGERTGDGAYVPMVR